MTFYIVCIETVSLLSEFFDARPNDATGKMTLDSACNGRVSLRCEVFDVDVN